MDESQIAQRDTQRRRDEMKRLIERLDVDKKEKHVVHSDAELGHARIFAGVKQIVQD